MNGFASNPMRRGQGVPGRVARENHSLLLVRDGSVRLRQCPVHPEPSRRLQSGELKLAQGTLVVVVVDVDVIIVISRHDIGVRPPPGRPDDEGSSPVNWRRVHNDQAK